MFGTIKPRNLVSLMKGIARMNSTSTLPSSKNILVSCPKEFVYHVQLNRPDKGNALNDSLWGEIKVCFDTISKDENCRVVVLSGNGKHFCTGLDLMSAGQNFGGLGEMDVARKAKIMRGLIAKFQVSVSSLEQCSKPVLTAVHSACIGAGVDFITAADMRYCTKDAWFQVKEVDIGLAADVGTLQRLPKVLGSESLARELCYTCRKFPAAEALSSGLVSRVFDNKEEMLEAVLKIAENISKKSPVAVQTTKRSLVYSRDHSVQEGLDHIALWNQMQLQSEDLIVSVTGALSKDEDIKFSKL